MLRQPAGCAYTPALVVRHLIIHQAPLRSPASSFSPASGSRTWSSTGRSSPVPAISAGCFFTTTCSLGSAEPPPAGFTCLVHHQAESAASVGHRLCLANRRNDQHEALVGVVIRLVAQAKVAWLLAAVLGWVAHSAAPNIDVSCCPKCLTGRLKTIGFSTNPLPRSRTALPTAPAPSWSPSPACPAGSHTCAGCA